MGRSSSYRNKHSHAASKFQTNLRCCCLSVSFSLLQDFVNTKISRVCERNGRNSIVNSAGKYSCHTLRCFLLELVLQLTYMIIFNSCFISNVAYFLCFSMCLSQFFVHSTLQGIQILDKNSGFLNSVTGNVYCPNVY